MNNHITKFSPLDASCSNVITDVIIENSGLKRWQVIEVLKTLVSEVSDVVYWECSKGNYSIDIKPKTDTICKDLDFQQMLLESMVYALRQRFKYATIEPFVSENRLSIRVVFPLIVLY